MSTIWIATGISGSGRIELLDKVKNAATASNQSVVTHDVGQMLREDFTRNGIPFVDSRILDADPALLRMARASVIKSIKIEVLKSPKETCHLISVHGTLRWRQRLIPGLSYQDLVILEPSGFLTIVDEAKRVWDKNHLNPKWDKQSVPNLQATQEWMVEEEFVTELFAEVFHRIPAYLVAKNHTPENLLDLFLSKKKKLYLSFPITAIQESHPEIIKEIQGPILERLQETFVVFNPWWIEDMPLANKKDNSEFPELLNELTFDTIQNIKNRTIERDFQFIDQADGMVCFYPTDKVSPGVLAEIYYAHRMQKPVFMVFSEKISPFLEDAVTKFESKPDTLLKYLEKEWALL